VALSSQKCNYQSLAPLPAVLCCAVLCCAVLCCAVLCLQVRYHPDKVPASAPLAERVMAEEVSKILNSHWSKR
jgi:hypothetical protein